MILGLIIKRIAIASLDHEVTKQTKELSTIIISSAREKYYVIYIVGSRFLKQIYRNCAVIGTQIQVVILAVINGKFRRAAICVWF
ncbi:hypothetical protein KC640_02700 [Candidatus Dojkabacteria bacterium]|uniref:Uncharacterized protein n=1 Tax=Candidatus Dojkabacteria bacterium TaxID=2099670 RepID=A0A955I9R7_9BACT|nr:hypothetical protein [Candidatus Dojkabacteria bacterium]